MNVSAIFAGHDRHSEALFDPSTGMFLNLGKPLDVKWSQHQAVRVRLRHRAFVLGKLGGRPFSSGFHPRSALMVAGGLRAGVYLSMEAGE
jgi:hypothetical protein